MVSIALTRTVHRNGILSHTRAHALLGVVAPVLAVEADKDGAVRDSHVGLEDEDIELLAGLVDSCDGFFMRNGLDWEGAEKVVDLCPVGGSARCIVVGNGGRGAAWIQQLLPSNRQAVQRLRFAGLK